MLKEFEENFLKMRPDPQVIPNLGDFYQSLSQMNKIDFTKVKFTGAVGWDFLGFLCF